MRRPDEGIVSGQLLVALASTSKYLVAIVRVGGLHVPPPYKVHRLILATPLENRNYAACMDGRAEEKERRRLDVRKVTYCYSYV